MVEGQLACRVALAAVLAAVFVSCKNVPSVELDLVSRQAVIKQKPDNSWNRNMEIHRRYPVVPIGFEITLEAAHIAPVLEVVVCIISFLEGDNFGKLTKKQRKSPPCPDYADGHIVLVQNKNSAIKPGIKLGGNHYHQLPNSARRLLNKSNT